MTKLKNTITLNPDTDQHTFDNLIKYAIAPRPICFASTVNAMGEVNLSPFSYFNLFSQHPPICVFSPLRRMRDGSTKHTYDNIQEVQEVVINIVNYDIVQQQSLASTEYKKGINEFEKAGLTAIPSLHVRPPRVAESPVQLECRIIQTISLSDQPGAGNLILAEVLCMHIHEHLIDDQNQINQADLDLVARLGGDWYCRVTKDNLFKVPKPLRNLGIGIDQLPAHIRLSTVLTGNHLAILANIEQLPAIDTSDKDQLELSDFIQKSLGDKTRIHHYAAKLIDTDEVHKAWQLLLSSQ